jgi:FkbM family methyltransferase
MINILCETPYEKWRAETLFTKEPGTVAWIQRECKPGDVFYDIGANIGQYTLMAARQVMPGGSVVAFEPHLMTAASLLKNIALNKMSGVTVITSALDQMQAFLSFHYRQVDAGSSGSQLGHLIDEVGEAFEPSVTELKHATTLDALLLDDVIPSPSLVKIDVDGNELLVLQGMRQALMMNLRLRSVQVEVHPSSHQRATKFMYKHGWCEVETHYTSGGQAEIDKGANPEKVFRNVIFERIPCSPV